MRLDFCGTITRQLGTAAPVTFTMTQAGESVSGTFSLGSLDFASLTSTIAADNSLAFAGTASSDNGTSIEASWRVTAATSTTLTGTYVQVWRTSGVPSVERLEGSLTQVTRAAQTSEVVRKRAEGPRGTIEDVLRLMTTVP